MAPYTKTFIAISLSISLAACGGGGSSGGTTSPSSATPTPSPTPTAPGTEISPGPTPTAPANFSVDATARFNTPTNLSIDNAGNLYVTDSGNGIVRKVAATGEVSTLDGRYHPLTQVAADPSLNLYAGSGPDFFRVASNKKRSLVGTFPKDSGNSWGRAAAIRADAGGRIYALYTGSNPEVLRIDPDGSYQSIFQGDAQASYGGLAVDGRGNLTIPVTDPATNASSLLRIPVSGLPATSQSGTVARTAWSSPLGKVELDGMGNTYSLSTTGAWSGDGGTYTVSRIRIERISSANASTVLYDGPPPSGAKALPPVSGSSAGGDAVPALPGLAVSTTGLVYFSDPAGHAVYRVADGKAVLTAGAPGVAGNSN